MPAWRVDPAVRERFPRLEVRSASLGDLDVRGGSAPDAAVVLAEVRTTRTLDGLKADPLFRAYRDFFWQLGLDPTKVRPSGEALNRRVLQGKDLPRINPFVDAYNLASLRTGVPIAAFDAARIRGDVALRFARAGEEFVSIGQDKRETLEAPSWSWATEKGSSRSTRTATATAPRSPRRPGRPWSWPAARRGSPQQAWTKRWP